MRTRQREGGGEAGAQRGRSLSLLICPEYAVGHPHVVVDTVYSDWLPARGHRVVMLRPDAGVRRVGLHEAPWPGGRLVTFPDEPLAGAVGNLPRALRRLAWLRKAFRLVQAERFDAVLVRNDLQIAGMAASWRRPRPLPLLFQVSSPEVEFRENVVGANLAARYARLRGRLDHRRRRRVCARAAAVLAISTRMREYLIERDGVPADRVFAFPMGIGSRPSVSDAEARQRAADLRLVAGRTLVYSGVIDPVRCPGFLLDVVEQVLPRVPDVRLLVLTYQRDERRARFEAEARQRKLPVTVVGPLHHREVGGYLRAADVMLSPYPPRLEHEMCSPTKTIEGLAAGLPVVGNEEVCEHRAMLTGVGGGLAVPFRAEAFAEAVVVLLQDAAARQRMADAGRAWAFAHRGYDRLASYLERILLAAADGCLPAGIGPDPDEEEGP